MNLYKQARLFFYETAARVNDVTMWVLRADVGLVNKCDMV